MIKKALFIIFLILLLTAPAYAQTSQPFALKDGFNFVSFTVNPTVTPAQLRSSYSSVSDIYLYNAAAGSFLSAAAGELTSLSAGKGYIIKSSGAASISVNGTSLSSVNVITLKTGFNLTGFSKMPETITFSQIMQRSQAIKGIYKWNSSAGSFVAVVRNGSTIEQLDGADPAMKAGESYFFNMLEETTLDYNVSPISIGGGSSNRVASPSFSPAGGTYSSPQNVTISCATSGAAIRYTTDGTTPTASSQLYISPISVSQTMTVSAIGIKAGLDNSYVSTATYTFGQTQAPAITSVVGTSVDNGNDTVKITFNTAMSKTAAETAANWTVKYDDDKIPGGETPLKLTATPFFYDSNNLTLTISLQKVTNMAYLPNGKYVVVTPSSNVKSAAGTPITASSVYSTGAVSGDINPPNPLADSDKSKIGFNNAAYKISLTSSLTANREPAILEVYAGSAAPSSFSSPTAKSVIKAANGFMTGDIITGMATVEVANAGVWYRFSDGAGNKSAWVQDGTIPAPPVVTKVSLNNQNGEINIGSTAITSSSASNNSIYVYFDTNGQGSGLTLHNYTLPGLINGINTVYTAVAKNNLWIPIAQGNQVSYAIRSVEDNISSRRYDISNPPSPIKASKVYISAYNKTIYCSTRLNDVDENADMALYLKINRGGSETIYKSGSKFSAADANPKPLPFGQFVHVSGDVITATFPRQGDKLYYALERAGRISSYTEDGDIPAAPDANKLAYYSSASSAYANGGYAVVSSNATADPQITAITCYQSDDSQGATNIFAKGSLTAITDWTRSYDFLARNSSAGTPNVINIETGKYVLYTHTNSSGNISAYTVDGVIPQKPVLPEPNVLVGAGDGGSGAEAAYINKNGHAAVKMRPGVPLITGEAISLKASSSDNRTIIMTARATLDATPVFGEQTPNISYISGPPANAGDPITGSFAFAGNLSTGDISVSASKINSNGNASEWGTAKILRYPASLLPPTVVLANCQATDDDYDGKLNTLVLEFNTEMKINGSLSVSKSLTGFHNGVTVFNGLDSSELMITGYELSANKRQLIIKFNNGVAGTGLVGINIVNADQNNFLSDLFGNRLAAINLDGGGGRAIPDRVAPTASKIIASNLSYNNATGKVVLSTAAIDCGEKAKLEIYFETLPAATTAEAAFSTSGKYSTGDLISGIAKKDKNINIKYRLNDEAKNSSAWVADGKVAEEPDVSKISYRAYETGNHVTVEAGAITGTSSTASKLICYQSDDATGTPAGLKEKGYIQGIDLTGAFSFTAGSGGVIAGGKHVLYSLINENGNISAFSADGTLPVTPALPAANLLVQNEDGGAGATAGFVNSAGAAAVKMRPAISLDLNEALTVKATLNEKTIKVSALATANGITPVFGNAPATANVTFSNFGDVKNGSADNGSLNFSTLSTGKVPVQAFKYNAVSGNASSWSSPAIEIIYGASDSQPIVKVDDCYAADDDKDGNLNYLYIRFDREMQIVGTLDPAAGTTKFHYGVTVFNGSIDVPLNITASGGYAMVNDADSKKTFLKIAFDDTVKGTGLVKLNIYNADTSNYISDLFGNKLAAKNLDGTAGNAIPDKVAPSSGTGILDQNNLFFSKASRKVECRTDINCSEKVKLDVFFGNYPSAATAASNTSALTASYTISAGTIMTQAEDSLPGDGSRVWYRLVDSTNTNKSDWVEDGTVPASPSTINLTWSDSASNVTISNSALASSTELLRIYRKNVATYTYLGRTVASGTHNDKLGPYAIGVSYPAEKDLTNEAVKVHVSPGDAVAYSIYNTSGNESSYATDTNSPPDVPLAEKLYVNAENASVNYSASLNNSTNDDLKLYVKITRGTTVAVYKASAFFDGDSAGELLFPAAFTLDSGTAIADFPKPGDAVEYALANSNNKISAYVPDGNIPTAPTNANKFTYNASTNTVNYKTTLNGSSNTAYKLYVSAADALNNNKVAFASNALMSEGPADITFESFTRATVKGAEASVYDTALPAVKAGILLKYGVINANGNISKLTSSITVPAAPAGEFISYSAATGMVTVNVGATAAGADATLSCYQADTVLGANLSALKGSVTGVNFAATTAKFEARTGGIIEANKYAVYTLTDVNGNVSAFANDGLIPAAPYPNKLFYSAGESSNNVNVFSGATTYTNANAVLTCYQSNDAAGTIATVKGSIKGSDVDGGGKNLTYAFKFTAVTDGAIGNGYYVLYTITNENGNESAYVADGTVPASPLVPAAASLIAAGDGGSFVSAGYVSTAGKTAVKMRPGVTLLSGETVTLKVADSAGAPGPHIIKMSASALAGITPIFGEQTPNAVYSAGATSDGNITTGSFNFTALTTKAVAASATITNTNGNSSAWSDPVINFTYNVADEAAPAITAASSYATDDDKDGKLNALVLKFTKPVKINGTLSTAAGAGNFHNVISVNNGTADTALNVTGYSIGGDNNDLLTITFDNTVVGTGQVKANIVNANASNFISDFYGVKLALTNLDASEAAKKIPDTVAPSASKINVANLYYSHATGKVALKNAAIDCGELAELQVYFGTDPTPATNKSFGTAASSQHAVKADLISGVAGAASGVYYRLVDSIAGTPTNKSDWVSDGGIPESPDAGTADSPNLAWSDATSQFTVNGISVGASNSVMRIYRKAGAAYTYLGRAVVNETNTDKKGAYDAGTHWAKQDGDLPVKVYSLPTDVAAYTLFNDNGNESAYAVDPVADAVTAPLAANLFVNAQEKTINCLTGLNGSANTGLRLCLKVTRGTNTAIYKAKTLFADNNGKILTFITDFDRTSTTSLDDFPMVGDAISYALESATGKISDYTADGTIPAGPLVTSKFIYDASVNKITYPASINGAVNTSYKLFVEASKGMDKVLFDAKAVFADNNSGDMVLDATKFNKIAIPALNEANVYSSRLKDGVAMKYSLIDANGNISASASGGTVPAAPDATKLSYSLALNSFTTLPGVTANTNTGVVLKCYLATDANGTGLTSKGSKTGINFSGTGTTFSATATIPANNYVLYTLTDEYGNTSAYTSDDIVPDIPAVTSLAYSAINGEVKTSGNVATNEDTNCVLKCYQADDTLGASNRIEKGSKSGVNFKNDTVTFTAATGGIISADKYVIYAFTNQYGNTSAFVHDGKVPFAPDSSALADLAIRAGSETGKYEVQGDVTPPSNLTASMTVLMTLDNATTPPAECGTTDGSSVYTKVSNLGNVSALALSMTPKYAYKNSNGNIGAISAADGALQSLSAVSLEPMGGVITFTFTAAVNGNPAQADLDTGKSGVMSLAANNTGTAASATASHVTDNWTITGDAGSPTRTFTINPGAKREQNIAGQILPFGDGTASGGKMFNLASKGTANVFDAAGGNFLIPASADRKISFNATNDIAPALGGVKGEKSAGVLDLLANGLTIISTGKFELEFNKPVLAGASTLYNSSTTAWAASNKPVFNGATFPADSTKKMTLTNSTAASTTVTTNDSLTITKTAVKDLTGKSPDTDYKFTVVSDITPPKFNSIAVQSAAYNNNVVTLTFSKSVWWGDTTLLTDPAHISAVITKLDSSTETRTISTINSRAKGAASMTLNITFAGAAITDGQKVKITITPAGAALIKDNTAQENPLDTTLLFKEVYYAADTTPPTFDGLTVQKVALDGNEIKLTFNEPVWWSSGLTAGDITVTVAGETRTLTAIDGVVLPNTPRQKASASTTINITINGAAITNGQVVFVAITLAGSAKIKDNSHSENVMQGTQNKSITASISASPNPSHFFANAKTKVVTIKGSTPNATVKVFKNADTTASANTILGSTGEGTASLSELLAGTSMSYSLTEAGKIESPRISDGIIPDDTINGSGGSTLNSCLQASGVTDKVKSNTSMAGTGCYLIITNASNTSYIASNDLVANTWVSPKSSRGGINNLPLDPGDIYYQFENADGNSSVGAVKDGSIAGTPDSTKVHIDASGKISSSTGTSYTISYTVYYTAGSNPPVTTLNENTSKMLESGQTLAGTAILPAVNSTVVGDGIQWVTYDSSSGNYSEGSLKETLVGVGTEASAYKNQVKITEGTNVDIFNSPLPTGVSMSYLKVLFTGPIVVTGTGGTLNDLTEISGPAIGATNRINTIITAVAGKTNNKVSIVLKIANSNTTTPPTFTVTPGTTKFNLTSATTRITDAHGNAVFPATAGAPVTTTGATETDD